MENKSFSNALVKAGDFIANLTSVQCDLFGYPTIKIYSDYVEVIFKTGNVIRNLAFLTRPCDEYRIYAEDSQVFIVFTFYSAD